MRNILKDIILPFKVIILPKQAFENELNLQRSFVVVIVGIFLHTLLYLKFGVGESRSITLIAGYIIGVLLQLISFTIIITILTSRINDGRIRFKECFSLVCPLILVLAIKIILSFFGLNAIQSLIIGYLLFAIYLSFGFQVRYKYSFPFSIKLALGVVLLQLVFIFTLASTFDGILEMKI